MFESGISEVLSFDEDLFLDVEDEIGDFPRFNTQSWDTVLVPLPT